MAERDLEVLATALTNVQHVRSGVGNVFRLLAEGGCDDNDWPPGGASNGTASGDSDPDESRRRHYIVQLKEALNTLTRRVHDLDDSVSSIQLPPAAVQLANSGLLSQDPIVDAQQRYCRLTESYRWLERAREYGGAGALLWSGFGALKRTQHALVKRRRGAHASGQAVANHHNDAILQSIARSFVDLRISVSRPAGSAAGVGGWAVVQVCLDRVLQASIAMRGLSIEWIQVRGFHESVQPSTNSSGYGTPDSVADLWTPSEYHVFRKVSEHAQAATLHFYGALHTEYSVRSYLTWLRSYSSLFSAVCVQCGCRLKQMLPPTWRDFKSLQPFHEECRS